MSSAELLPGLPVRRPVAEAAAARSPRVRLVALVKLAVVGGLAFAIGFFAMVAMRSFGWGAGLVATVSGSVLIANVVGRLYAG
jgi:hypothetical protein